MKKILPLLLLLFVLIMPGCGDSDTNFCYFSGKTPNRLYLVTITYGDGSIATYNIMSDPAGAVTVRTTASCLNVVVTPLTSSNLSLSANPSSIDLLSPPSTITITGQSFDTTYGMPRVEYFDGDGYLVGAVYATSVSGNTSLTANAPDLSLAYSGSYQIRVTNKASEGYYSHRVGTADVSAYGRDRLDSDSDGWYDDEDCAPYDPDQNAYCSNCPEDSTAITCP
jgi:hypothetical protein